MVEGQCGNGIERLRRVRGVYSVALYLSKVYMFISDR